MARNFELLARGIDIFVEHRNAVDQRLRRDQLLALEVSEVDGDGNFELISPDQFAFENCDFDGILVIAELTDNFRWTMDRFETFPVPIDLCFVLLELLLDWRLQLLLSFQPGFDFAVQIVQVCHRFWEVAFAFHHAFGIHFNAET